VVSNPAKTRAIAEAKVKTDTVDAQILAQLLAADYLPTVWRPDPATARYAARFCEGRTSYANAPGDEPGHAILNHQRPPVHGGPLPLPRFRRRVRRTHRLPTHGSRGCGALRRVRPGGRC
jgi:hypothetical protein